MHPRKVWFAIKFWSCFRENYPIILLTKYCLTVKTSRIIFHICKYITLCICLLKGREKFLGIIVTSLVTYEGYHHVQQQKMAKYKYSGYTYINDDLIMNIAILSPKKGMLNCISTNISCTVLVKSSIDYYFMNHGWWVRTIWYI